MIRHVFSRSRATVGSRRAARAAALPADAIEAGAGRTAVGVIVLPTVSLAAGMHFLPDFRAFVEDAVPGATEALASVTGADYAVSTGAAKDQGKKEGSNLPPNYEKLPDLMNRIEKEKKSSDDGASPGYFKQAMAAAGAGEKERAEHSPKFVEELGSAAAAAKSTANGAVAAVTGGATAELKKAEEAAAAGEKKIADTSEGYMASLSSAAAGLFSGFGGTSSGTETAKEPAKDQAAPVSGTSGSLVGDFADGAAAAKAKANDALGAAQSGVEAAAKNSADSASQLGANAKQAARGAGDAFGNMGDKASDALHSTSDAVASAASGAGGKLMSVAHDAEDSISSAAHKASDALHGTADAVASAASAASEKFMSVAHNAEDSIASVAGRASTAAHDFADRATSVVKGDPSATSVASSSGALQSSSDGSQGASSSAAANDEAVLGTKLARLLGRGDYDPATVEGKDVVDTNVYKRPSWSSSAAPSPPRASLGGAATPSVATVSSGEGVKSPEVDALQAELASQTKWDAVRLQEAVRAQSVADKKAASAELAAVMKKHKAQLAQAQEEAFSKAQETLAAKTKVLEAEMLQRRDTEVAKLLKEKEDSIRTALESEYLERERKAAIDRERELASLKASVDALNNDLDNSREHRKASQAASLGTAAAFSLKNALQGNGSFESELTNAARTSELGKLVADSIPETAVSSGLPTANELKSSFQSVSLESRKATLVPERDVGTIWGHLLASVVSRLKVAVDTGNKPFVPFTDEERILLAGKHIDQGDIAKAVDVLAEVDGLPGDILSDWIAAAKARMAADLGSEALLADSILKQQALAAAAGAPEEPTTAECYF